MKLDDFLAQDKHCRANNTPEGSGCDTCPAGDKEHCADALRNLGAKLVDNMGTRRFGFISKQLERDYGLTPYNQLVIFEGVLEFPE